MKIGDIVYLKSGGPPMVVEEISVDGKNAVCSWYHEGAVQHYDFPLACVTSEEPEVVVLKWEKAEVD